jgi:D-alanyl-D-alanine carboxypeptidase/D-alanyl-D-alanine-endopeptidase (penicillin-binding protein 4)
VQSPSVISRLIKTVLFLSGWAVAIFLGWRCHTSLQNDAMPATLERTTDPAIAKSFREFSAQPELQGALIGFCLLDEKGNPIYASPLAETALCPASALKTVTTAAALEILGTDFRFETSLCSSGESKVSRKKLDGDLILVGSGDPTLSTADLELLADQLLANGVFEVTGRLVADVSAFPENPISDHWNWGDIGNAYGAGAYGLNVDHNRLTAAFEPGATIGSPAKLLGAGPSKEGTKWINRVLTGPPGSGDQTVIYSEPYGSQVTLRGTIPVDAKNFTTGGAIPDPAALALEIVRKRLIKGGVTFGNVQGAKAGPRQVLARHASAPLPEIIDHLHKVSDNLEAQCLFLTLGSHQNLDPVEALRQHWESAGVSFAAWRMLDGSGLARANMIRPVDLARVNYFARHGARGDRFLQSLSVYANGTISSKLGAMSGVKTEVGFLRCANGRELTFALMANGLGPGVDFWRLKGSFLESIRTEIGR